MQEFSHCSHESSRMCQNILSFSSLFITLFPHGSGFYQIFVCDYFTMLRIYCVVLHCVVLSHWELTNHGVSLSLSSWLLLG